jgi:ABC-type multidrug transport system permease subunit
MPRWFEQVARLNPVTWYLDAARSILAGNTDWGFVGLTAGFIIGLTAISYGLAVRAFVRLDTRHADAGSPTGQALART